MKIKILRDEICSKTNWFNNNQGYSFHQRDKRVVRSLDPSGTNPPDGRLTGPTKGTETSTGELNRVPSGEVKGEV